MYPNSRAGPRSEASSASQLFHRNVGIGNTIDFRSQILVSQQNCPTFSGVRMEHAELKQESPMISVTSVVEGGVEEDGLSDSNADGVSDTMPVGKVDGISNSLLEGVIDSICFVVGTDDGTSDSLLNREEEGVVGRSEGTGVDGTVL